MKLHPRGIRTRRSALLPALLALSLAAVACGGDDDDAGAGAATTAPGASATSGAPAETQGDDAAAPSGEVLVAAIGNESENLDVGKIRAGTDYYVAVNLYEQLIGRDAEGNQVPGLATEWSVSDDGLEYHFTLREGVTFHNGEPFDAEDVKFSYERYVDPETGNVFAFRLAGLESVTIDAPNEVTIRLKEPDGAFLSSGGVAYMVPKDYIEAGGPDVMQDAPVGTGPFKFVSRQIGQGVRFERFDDYWGAPAGYEQLDLRIIPDDNARVSALQSGQVDLIAQVPPQNVAELEDQSGLKVAESVTGDNIFILYNYQIPDAPWLDPRVREAMELAIDQEALQEVVLGGLGVPLAGVSALNSAYDDTEITQREYDPERAKELLTEAGYADGFTMEFTAPVNGRLPNSEQVAQALTGFWNDIGINVDLKLLEYSQWVDSERRDSGVNGVVFGLGGDQGSFDPQQRMLNHLTCTAPYGNMCDEEVDAMIETVQTTVDPAERDAAIEALFQYVHDNALVLWLYTAEGAFAMSDDVEWTPWHGTPYTPFFTAHPA